MKYGLRKYLIIATKYNTLIAIDTKSHQILWKYFLFYIESIEMRQVKCYNLFIWKETTKRRWLFLFLIAKSKEGLLLMRLLKMERSSICRLLTIKKYQLSIKSMTIILLLNLERRYRSLDYSSKMIWWRNNSISTHKIKIRFRGGKQWEIQLLKYGISRPEEQNKYYK